jgi:integrase
VASPVKLPAVRKPRGKAWSSEEARRFLESARNDGDPLYAAYVLVLVLGLRRGEALGLRWSDIDLDRAELTVGLQLQRIRRQLHHRATKTEGSDATLPLPPICVTALGERRAGQRTARSAAGPVWQQSDLVFTTQFGRPAEPRNFFRSFVGRTRRVGIPRISVDDARRTCATLLADLDVHPRVAMQILRHADSPSPWRSTHRSRPTRPGTRSSGSATAWADHDYCCTSLLYEQKRGHIRRWIMASELGGAEGI